MAASILTIRDTDSVSVQRSGAMLSGDELMALQSGDRLIVGPLAEEPDPGLGQAPGVVAAASEGAVWSILPKSSVEVRYFQLRWDYYSKRLRPRYRMILPSPLGEWVEIVQRYLPSLFGHVRTDMHALEREWMGDFWSGLPDGSVDIVPIAFELQEGALVGSVSAVGGTPALHRLRIPGAWYETSHAVYLVQVSEPDDSPENWRSVEVFCESGKLQVDFGAGKSPVLLDSGQGVSYSVRNDGTATTPDMLSGIPGEVQVEINRRAFGWHDLTGASTHTVGEISPGTGAFRFLEGLPPENVIEILLNGLTTTRLEGLSLSNDHFPYYLGVRMTGQVAENEGTMFEEFLDEGLWGRAEPQVWMQDIQVGDPVKLYLRVPRELLSQLSQPSPKPSSKSC